MSVCVCVWGGGGRSQEIMYFYLNSIIDGYAKEISWFSCLIIFSRMFPCSISTLIMWGIIAFIAYYIYRSCSTNQEYPLNIWSQLCNINNYGLVIYYLGVRTSQMAGGHYTNMWTHFWGGPPQKIDFFRQLVGGSLASEWLQWGGRGSVMHSWLKNCHIPLPCNKLPTPYVQIS